MDTASEFRVRARALTELATALPRALVAGDLDAEVRAVLERVGLETNAEDRARIVEAIRALLRVRARRLAAGLLALARQETTRERVRGLFGRLRSEIREELKSEGESGSEGRAKEC